MYSISICINDLVSSGRAKKAGNGKHYIDLTVANKKEKDQFDNDATVYCKQTAEERAAKDGKIFLGDGRWFEFEDKKRPENAVYEISVCLEDLRDHTKVSPKNGKQYVSICIADRKEPGKYGETAVVFISQTEEQRKAGEPKKYCGSGKLVQFNVSQPAEERDLKKLFSIPLAAK